MVVGGTHEKKRRGDVSRNSKKNNSGILSSTKAVKSGKSIRINIFGFLEINQMLAAE